MKRFFTALFLVILIPIGGVAVLLTQLPPTPHLPTSDLVAKVENGTVLISNQIDASTGAIGTGFQIQDNMFITNNHVIVGTNNKIQIISPNSPKRYDATVIYTDPVADIAVLALKDWPSYVKNENPVSLSLGDSDTERVGNKVVVIGNPWGLTWTVSEGIMSAKNRQTGPIPKYVDQVDAKIFEGNSGGPVFNDQGQVICVSELMLTGNGGSYGMCIPSNLVKKILQDFNTFHQVRWRALNFTIGLTDDGSSVTINNIEANGAADKAGLKVGDKLLEIYTPNNPAGTKIIRPDDLIKDLALMGGNDFKIQLMFQRDGKIQMIDVNTHYRLSSEYPSVNNDNVK